MTPRVGLAPLREKSVAYAVPLVARILSRAQAQDMQCNDEYGRL